MSKRQFLSVLVVTAVFAFLGGTVSNGFLETPVKAQELKIFGGSDFKLPDGHFLATVEQGKLNMIVPHRPLNIPIRLTRIQMQEARPADSAEIDLKQYEGKVILINGYDGGDWIYNASVTDSGGPLMTLLVKKVFGKPKTGLFQRK